MNCVEESALLNLAWTGLDFEGAGSYNGQEDAPVQVGIGQMVNGRLNSTYREYLYVNRQIAPIATSVHRITNAMLAGKPKLIEIWPIFEPWWGKTIIVAHNVATEKKFTRIFNMSATPLWVDTLKISRAQYPFAPNHSLTTMLELVKGTDEVKKLCSFEAHDALFDAIGTLILLRKLLTAKGWETLSYLQAHNLSTAEYNSFKTTQRKA